MVVSALSHGLGDGSGDYNEAQYWQTQACGHNFTQTVKNSARLLIYRSNNWNRTSAVAEVALVALVAEVAVLAALVAEVALVVEVALVAEVALVLVAEVALVALVAKVAL